MTRDQANEVCAAHLLPAISDLYGLEGYTIRLIGGHKGGRNLVYSCDRQGADGRVIRVAFLPDRSREHLLGEVEFIRYLADRGGSVANVITSRNGSLLEELSHGGHRFYVCVFEKAKGKLLRENGYRYRPGVPISEYYYNCGKTLGKLHQLSKEYTPIHRRYSFFDKYNPQYIHELIPRSFSLLKERMIELLEALEELERSPESFGMIHFDYNDGNYAIDFDTGQITVFDFDNSCFGWYMYDVAASAGRSWRTTSGRSWPDTEARPRSSPRCWTGYPCSYRSPSWRTSWTLSR
jgi:Ser/Thr protein kinase RdoA (MazF antagonist)